MDSSLHHLEVLKQWQALGQKYLALSLPDSRCWSAVSQLIQAAGRVFQLEADRARRLLEDSSRLFAPLGDPLLIDFGAHRWLSGNREESYSDWLAWVIERVGGAEEIFGILGLTPPQECLGAEFSVAREVCIPSGQEGQTGRLDLVIRFGKVALVVIEVKLTSAEDADTEKNKGYQKWVSKQISFLPENRYSLLLVTRAEEFEYGGFRTLLWSELCIRLRRLVRRKLHSDLSSDLAQLRIEAALTLAFVGAVEQNLIGFSAAYVKRITQKHDFATAEIADYLEKSLQKEYSDADRQ